MKYITSIFFALIGAFIVVFSVNNLHHSLLDPWPFADPVGVPTFLIVLVSMLVGLFLGAGIIWFAGLPRRWRAHTQRRELKKLKTQTPPTAIPSVPVKND